MFIDDVNLPGKDENNVQRCNELLRTLMDDHAICKLTKPFEWRTIEGLEVTVDLQFILWAAALALSRGDGPRCSLHALA